MRYGRVAILGLVVCASLQSARAADEAPSVKIVFSGILGQSEPPDAPPLPFVGAGGIAADGAGTLWVAGGSTLYAFKSQHDVWRCARTLSAPGNIGAVFFDGRRLLAQCEQKLFRVDTMAGKVDPNPVCTFADGCGATAVAPDELKSGFAAQARYFGLRGDEVLGYGEDGQSKGCVLKLVRPEKAPWNYCSLTIEPHSGDLLVGSYWPDWKVYRFAASGQEVKTGWWPRTANSARLVIAGGQAWALQEQAVALPATLAKAENALTIHSQGFFFPSGLAVDPAGNYWIASSQGVTQFDPRGQPTGRRLGGISGIRALACARDGDRFRANWRVLGR